MLYDGQRHSEVSLRRVKLRYRQLMSLLVSRATVSCLRSWEKRKFPEPMYKKNK